MPFEAGTLRPYVHYIIRGLTQPPEKMQGVREGPGQPTSARGPRPTSAHRAAARCFLAALEKGRRDRAWEDGLYPTIWVETQRKPATSHLRHPDAIAAGKELADCPALLLRGGCGHRYGYLALADFTTGPLVVYSPRIKAPSKRPGGPSDLGPAEDSWLDWAMFPLEEQLASGQSVGSMRTATTIRGVSGDVFDRVGFECPKRDCRRRETLRQDTLITLFCEAVANGEREVVLRHRSPRQPLELADDPSPRRVYKPQPRLHRSDSGISQRHLRGPIPAGHECTVWCVPDDDLHCEMAGPSDRHTDEQIKTQMREVYGVGVVRIQSAAEAVPVPEGSPPARLIWWRTAESVS